MYVCVHGSIRELMNSFHPQQLAAQVRNLAKLKFMTYMAREDDVDPVGVEQVLHLQPHALKLPVMRAVAVVPGRVPDGDEPGRDRAVDERQVGLGPRVLRAGLAVVVVGCEHEEVDAGSIEGVVEAGGRAALGVRHREARLVGSEGHLVLLLLVLVVALDHIIGTCLVNGSTNLSSNARFPGRGPSVRP